MPPPPAHKYRPLLTPGRQLAVRNPPVVSSRTVTEFLENKVLVLTGKRDSLLVHKEGLLQNKDTMTEKEFLEQLAGVVDTLAPKIRDIRVPSRSKHVLEQDMHDELASKKSVRMSPELSSMSERMPPPSYPG